LHRPRREPQWLLPAERRGARGHPSRHPSARGGVGSAGGGGPSHSRRRPGPLEGEGAPGALHPGALHVPRAHHRPAATLTGSDHRDGPVRPHRHAAVSGRGPIGRNPRAGRQSLSGDRSPRLHEPAQQGREGRMGRFTTALLVVASILAFGPSPSAHATDINENPECQRMFQRYAQPYFDQMQWFGSVAPQYPLTPNGRPIMAGWPYAGYGPGNGYGPGSPYGPNFGPWGVNSFGPGFGGPGGYGITPDGFGGPVYQGAGAYAALGAA